MQSISFGINPRVINLYRDAGGHYDVMEAKDIMKYCDPEFGDYVLYELFSRNNFLFSDKAFEDLHNAVINLPSGSTVITVYTAGGFSFGLYRTSSYILLDTHPVSATSNGDMNGCRLFTKHAPFTSALAICAWIFKRLAYALSPGKYFQSLTLLKVSPYSRGTQIDLFSTHKNPTKNSSIVEPIDSSHINTPIEPKSL